VRPATALRIALVIAAAWALALLVQLGRGLTVTRASAGGLLAAVALVGGIGFLAQRFRIVPRRGSFADQAAAAGLRAEAGDPLGLLGSPYSLFHLAAAARDVENTAAGVRAGREIAVVDYWFAPSSNPSRDDIRRYVGVLDAERGSWPDIAVLPSTVAADARDAIGSRGVELESEAFNRSFDVRCEDPRFANALLDARMIDWLLSQDADLGIQVIDGRLLVYGRRSASSVDDVAQALSRYDGFLDHVPSVVGSLYPAVAGVDRPTA
jgi:hypothetical protein